MPSAFSVTFKIRTMKNIKYTIILFYLLLSCNKLDIKPDLSRVVPSTLEDFQGILDNSETIFNITYNSFGEIAANDFQVKYEDYQANFTPLTSEIYIWNTTNLNDPFIYDWNTSYSRILNCNIVLDGLSKNPVTDNLEQLKNIKGQATFHRAHSFYMLAEEFAPVYDEVNLLKKAIPLRTSSDINLTYPRSSVGDTYKLIVDDLKIAIDLLPETQKYKSRPSKPSAYALLARVYLAMDDYSNALKYADSCIVLKSDLIDYNELNTTLDYPIVQFNSEVIFFGSMSYDHLLSRNVLQVSKDLLELYEENDLRKDVFFFEKLDGSFGFKGSYNGQGIDYHFEGMAVDEVYLIQAECHARLNQPMEALTCLNKLLKKRYEKSSFIPVNITTQENLIRRILQERRKELLFRGLRWTDLRRLNKDSRFAVTLIRELNGQTYTLPPNDPRYVFPIPKYVSTIKD